MQILDISFFAHFQFLILISKSPPVQQLNLATARQLASDDSEGHISLFIDHDFFLRLLILRMNCKVQ
jgi:hypothetical protein